ncbi:MAG: hypothetical protein M1829_004953 [Trizodia sp. TS-e1964]|nr:MAG: hypothetical protein M1829_004953 [Trizodia sp. TS-e1964]
MVRKPVNLVVLSSDSEESQYGDTFASLGPLSTRSGGIKHQKPASPTSRTTESGKGHDEDCNGAADADDEDDADDILAAPHATALKGKGPSSPPRIKSILNRPKGRYWFDHVAITSNHKRQPTPLTPSTPSRLLTTLPLRNSSSKKRPQEKVVASPEICQLPLPPRSPPISVHSDTKSESPSPHKRRRRLIRRPTSPKKSPSTTSSISAYSNTHKRAISSSDFEMADATDVSKNSTMTSSFNEKEDESQHSAAGEMSSTNKPSDRSNTPESDDDIEVIAIKAKRAPLARGKRTQQSRLSFGGNFASAKHDAEPMNVDRFKYKPGLKEDLPPLHDIEEIFEDMVHKGLKTGLKKAIDHLNSRKLKIATMCSGTESPVLALGLVSDSLKKLGIVFEIEHLFSAEIVPFKQAYIERNFSPPLLFRDIKEIASGDTATTAYGATATVPGGVDMLVAGFSCVDFSNLNNKKRFLEETGESGDTLRAIIAYAERWHPRIIILENVFGAPWPKLKKAWEDHTTYSAEFHKLDTKDYYLPHTRQRGYMICIDNQSMKKSRAAVDSWTSVLKSFQRPASSSIEAFLLPEDDPRVHRGREELAKGARGDDKAPREVDWTRCQGRHQDYRANLLLGSKRPLTHWEDNGSCKVPDYAWGEWAVGQVERIWDTFEISHLRNARRGWDSQYKTRVWELSQNIDRFTDTTPFGITGCMTPTGVPYVTNRGGPMTGPEVLAMQGIPIDKLQITRESQKQLQDLAGNAMSSTVVGAAMLAALIVGYKALDAGDGQQMIVDRIADVTGEITGEDTLEYHSLDLGGFDPIPVSEILQDAMKSARRCICEGRALMTETQLQECAKCSHSTCIKCGGNPPHHYKSISKEEQDNRMAPSDFESKIKNALPMRVIIQELSEDMLENIKTGYLTSGDSAKINEEDWRLLLKSIAPALGVELRFQSLQRGQFWTIVYDSPTSRMELILDPYQAEWRLYAKPNKKEPVNSRARALLTHPFARMRPSGLGLVTGEWQFCLPTILSLKIDITGAGEPVRSWESLLGLQEPKFADKHVWPQLKVSVPQKDIPLLDVDISGTYDLLQKCGTASESLHKLRSKPGEKPIFLFFDPSPLGEPSLDYFVFSADIRRLNFGETRQIISRNTHTWRPNAKDKVKTIDTLIDGQWVQCPGVYLQPVSTKSNASMYGVPPSNFNIILAHDTCSSASAILTCRIPLKVTETVGWKLGDWLEVSKVNEKLVLASFSWLTERVRLIKELDEWKHLDSSGNLDRCLRCAPQPASMRWKIQKGKLTPYEDSEKAAPYEQALKNRPSPFVIQTRINDELIGCLRIGLNIASLVHRAYANLLAGTDNSKNRLQLSWHLSTDYVQPPKFSRPVFSLQSNKLDEPSEQPPGFDIPLRLEQLRSLRWMREQEAEDVKPFVEEEIEEALLPQLGWRAEGRATKEIVVRGGVLADQVGYGKTATTIALIDYQFKNGKKPDLEFKDDGKIPTKATLIVVPAHLINQWGKEVNKFMGGRCYRVIVIKTLVALKTQKISDFMSAHIIIVSWNIFNSDTYLTSIARFAALPEAPDTTGFGGRAFDAWYLYSLGRLSDHVNELVKNGPAPLSNTLKKKLADTEADEELIQIVPSKRLRGRAYQLAHSKTGDATGGQKSGAAGKLKRKAKSMEGLNEVDEEPKSQSHSGPDPFGLSKAKSNADWRNVTCPLFAWFHFNRLVIDEYTYVMDKKLTGVTNLSANNRWVLSGTPPLGDFADIKTISTFLGIHLGIDDDTVGVMKAKNIKQMQKDRTATENFQSFREIRSVAWHQNRDQVAQRFLNQFVRQNIAEIDEIPFEEHLKPIVLPAAERAIYLELQHFLQGQDMKFRKGKTRNDNDRMKRFTEIMGESKTPEEALMKRASHFTLKDLEIGSENAVQACDLIIKHRSRQYEEATKEMKVKLRHAAWLKSQCKEKDEHFAKWVGTLKTNGLGDLEASQTLLDMIDYAQKNTRSKDEGEFYRNADSKDADDGGKKQKKPAKKPKKKKAKRAKRDDTESEDSEDSEAEASDDYEDPVDTRAVKLPMLSEKVQALRDLSSNLRALASEIVVRKRSLRFFKIVRALQQAAPDGYSCAKCGKSKLKAECISVFCGCGHTSCQECLSNSMRGDDCIVAGCGASARDFYIEKATELGEEDPSERVGRHYGRKIEEVIQLVKTKIPANDQVLLFVQFDDLMKKVFDALKEQGISVASLRMGSGKSNAADVMSDFQENRGVSRKKVLVLNIADESASGANLTNANHIIFLSPILTDSQYRYDSSMTQAIGRARRFGQKKTVYIYHFLSLKTIDVDIMELRSGKKLARRASDGSFAFVEVKDLQVGDTTDFGAGLAKNMAKFESD